MVLLASTVLSGTAANFDLTSISGSYNHLELIAITQSDQAAGVATHMIFNNDSGANYDYEWVYGEDAVTTAFNGVAANFIYPGATPSATPAPTVAAMFRIVIPCYAATTFHKTCSCQQTFKGNTGSVLRSSLIAGWWRNTAAITRITLTPAAGLFTAGSSVYLYGIT